MTSYDRLERIKKLEQELALVRKQQARLAGQITRSALRRMMKAEEIVSEAHVTLRELRLANNLSQTTVSAALGRKSNVISRIETGKSRRLSLERFVKLRALYGQSAKELAP